MTELELLKVIGYAQDAYLLDVEELPVKEVSFLRRHPALLRAVAAMVAVTVALGLFLQTPAGIATAAAVKAKLEQFLDVLFPPKDALFYVDGVQETVPVQAQGREPQLHTPGFSLYVDTAHCRMTEEDGGYFLRPTSPAFSRENTTPEQRERVQEMTSEQRDAFYAGLSPVEMEIRELPGQPPREAAQRLWAAMEGQWEDLVTPSEGTWRRHPEAVTFHAGRGLRWGDAQESHYFLSNSREGCFHIIIRDFVGSQWDTAVFVQMLDTFTVVAPQDAEVCEDARETLIQAMHREIAYAQEQDIRAAQSGAEDAAERNARWLSVHAQLWSALEQTLDADTMEDLLAEQLNWGAEKRVATLASAEEGRAARAEENARWVEQRALTLLSYLEGTAQPPEHNAGLIPSPEETVTAFAEAYFRGDRATLMPYLAETFTGEPEIYRSGTEVVNACKGMDDVPAAMAEHGCLFPSVEFRERADSDSYNYLSVTLVWEEGRWAVEAFGLEK